ncbi:hypothetical protein CYMTET_48057 [Cymbomonas tetramitiformis]|uniref:Uncharacterized protein n=1 Tax=Cymbomonas tetramitiformis TaxID=36881 RepID=A0AAE0BUM0_9CHLO|nr:hypothetical protein CYMTET_48057 [Cymbomonas tetramitiformis]
MWKAMGVPTITWITFACYFVVGEPTFSYPDVESFPDRVARIGVRIPLASPLPEGNPGSPPTTPGPPSECTDDPDFSFLMKVGKQSHNGTCGDIPALLAAGNLTTCSGLHALAEQFGFGSGLTTSMQDEAMKHCCDSCSVRSSSPPGTSGSPPNTSSSPPTTPSPPSECTDDPDFSLLMKVGKQSHNGTCGDIPALLAAGYQGKAEKVAATSDSTTSSRSLAITFTGFIITMTVIVIAKRHRTRSAEHQDDSQQVYHIILEGGDDVL